MAYITHGLTKHPLYKVYAGIKQRCYDKNHHLYKMYGSKGILMCIEWFNDFKLFYDWANANDWQRGLHVDRINHRDGYSPQNCRIVTARENLLNRYNTVLLEYKNQVKPLSIWADELNISHNNLYRRVIENGMSIDDAIDFWIDVKKYIQEL